nr:FAD/NAD(P)-binding protein [Chthonobacter rhizosphaerae]
MDRTEADVAVIGSGVAGCCTVLSLFDRLRRSPRWDRPVDVVVVERDDQAWTGLPYGRRSSPNALIITTAAEFLPAELADRFAAWFVRERPRWTADLAEAGGECARAWQDRNADAIASGRFAEAYIPRRLFGAFLQAEMADAIEAARRDGLATVTVLHGEATDLRRAGQGFVVSVARSDSPVADLAAGSVVLAVGSPPGRSILPPGVSPGPGSGLIDDAYAPSFDATLSAVRERLLSASPDGRNLLIVGANASALELVYVLAHDRRLSDAARSVVVLSPGGQFPHRISGGPEIDLPTPAMDALLAAGGGTALDVMTAAERDVDAALQAGLTVGDGFGSVGAKLGALFEMLGTDETRAFHEQHGMHFSRLIRRAGREYRDAADRMRQSGALLHVAGALDRLEPASNSGWTLHYRSSDGSSRTADRSFAAVVNCSGFEEVDAASSSPLIRSLVRSGLIEPNPTRRGIAVDETLAASEGIFVVGPLLGGVFTSQIRMWHVENVRRIHSIAPHVAESLAVRLGLGQEPREQEDRHAG